MWRRGDIVQLRGDITPIARKNKRSRHHIKLNRPEAMSMPLNAKAGLRVQTRNQNKPAKKEGVKEKSIKKSQKKKKRREKLCITADIIIIFNLLLSSSLLRLAATSVAVTSLLGSNHRPHSFQADLHQRHRRRRRRLQPPPCLSSSTAPTIIVIFFLRPRSEQNSVASLLLFSLQIVDVVAERRQIWPPLIAHHHRPLSPTTAAVATIFNLHLSILFSSPP